LKNNLSISNRYHNLLIYQMNRVSIDVFQRVDGGTPIHLACRLGALEILTCLYEHDKDVFTDKLVDREGMTPLHRYPNHTLFLP